MPHCWKSHVATQMSFSYLRASFQALAELGQLNNYLLKLGNDFYTIVDGNVDMIGQVSVPKDP